MNEPRIGLIITTWITLALVAALIGGATGAILLIAAFPTAAWISIAEANHRHARHVAKLELARKHPDSM